MVFGFAFAASAFIAMKVMPKLRSAGIVGKDMHKAEKPEIPEMGGVSIVAGYVGAVLFGIALNAFFGFSFRIPEVFAALIAALIVAIIGVFDDMLDIAQRTKALLPLVAAVPLIAVEVFGGNNSIALPLLGMVDFGIAYPLLLVPLAIAVCSNLTNMLAGYNGLEAGLGAIIFAAISIIAFTNGQAELTLISIAMLGALLGFLPFNAYPAKVFIGDVGALTIGAALASGVIVSALKSAGAILMIPFVLDFFLKAANGFPKSFAELRAGKLHAPHGKIRGLADLVLTVRGGLSEKQVTYSLYAIEIVFALIAIAMYAKF